MLFQFQEFSLYDLLLDCLMRSMYVHTICEPAITGVGNRRFLSYYDQFPLSVQTVNFKELF